jgi:protoporphyrinogen IX oxidase
MLYHLAIFLHLIGFAAFAGAAFAQQRLMGASRRASIAAQMRDTYESLAASIVTKVELPAAFLSVISGVLILSQRPFWLKNGWLHVKLTVVVILLILAHLEMFNARRLVRARNQRGDQANGEISARKARHAVYGSIGFFGVLVILGVVAFGLTP